MYNNSSPKGSAHLNLTILCFCLIFRLYWGKYACNCSCKIWYPSDKFSLLLTHTHFWVASAKIWVGRPEQHKIWLYGLAVHLQHLLVLTSCRFPINGTGDIWVCGELVNPSAVNGGCVPFNSTGARDRRWWRGRGVMSEVNDSSTEWECYYEACSCTSHFE